MVEKASIDRDVALRLKVKRKSLGLTQEKAAEKLEITHTHYSAIENARKDFSKSLLVRIVKVFGISADYLLFGKIDNKIADEMADLINSLPNNKRQSAYRVISELIEGLKL